MSLRTSDLISMVESLPIDVKITLVEKILESLQPSQKEIDELWYAEVEKRIKDIKTGRVKPIPGDEVFKQIPRSSAE